MLLEFQNMFMKWMISGRGLYQRQ